MLYCNVFSIIILYRTISCATSVVFNCLSSQSHLDLALSLSEFLRSANKSNFAHQLWIATAGGKEDFFAETHLSWLRFFFFGGWPLLHQSRWSMLFNLLSLLKLLLARSAVVCSRFWLLSAFLADFYGTITCLGSLGVLVNAWQFFMFLAPCDSLCLLFLFLYCCCFC